MSCQAQVFPELQFVLLDVEDPLYLHLVAAELGVEAGNHRSASRLSFKAFRAFKAFQRLSEALFRVVRAENFLRSMLAVRFRRQLPCQVSSLDVAQLEDFAESRGRNRRKCDALHWSLDTRMFSFYRLLAFIAFI